MTGSLLDFEKRGLWVGDGVLDKMISYSDVSYTSKGA
jgi:hypothetical protein